MSASTPTVQGGTRNLPLGAALIAIALAIVVVAALVAFQAAGSRGQTQAAPIAGSPNGATRDQGWDIDNGAAAAPVQLELPRPFDPSTLSAPAGPTLIELPRPFDPSTIQAPVGGGRGTRFAN